MRTIVRSTILVAICIIATAEQANAASCICWDGFWNTWICPGGWTPVPGRTLVYYSYGRTAEDAKKIGSCVAAGDVPPEKVCSASVSGTKVKTAVLKGELSVSDFGFSGTLGEELNVNQSCGGNVTIRSWCSCCKTRARVKFKNTRKCGTCTCLTCRDFKCGILTEYVGVVCDEGDPECTIPVNCHNRCPPSA